MSEPWTKERRSQKSDKILKECHRSAARLNAKGVIMIAFFEDDDKRIHMLDAGIAPYPLPEIYKIMIGVHEKTAEGQEGFVQ